ncbi:uncharacterized methyltransferase, chloroplastic [Tanacetum coccineum]
MAHIVINTLKTWSSILITKQSLRLKIPYLHVLFVLNPLYKKRSSWFQFVSRIIQRSAIYRSGFKCIKCNKSYSSKNIYLDLTVIAGAKEYVESQPSRTELFRYEYVVLDFVLTGFDKVRHGSGVLQTSRGWNFLDDTVEEVCFSRKFQNREPTQKNPTLDFSENMLRQTYDFIKVDDTILSSNLALVRADVSRLPFASGSIDAVHAGAALHCWPSPSNAIAEINRILRSGGVFVGTTFLRSTSTTL